jgi:hypothetical protein
MPALTGVTTWSHSDEPLAGDEELDGPVPLPGAHEAPSDPFDLAPVRATEPFRSSSGEIDHRAGDDDALLRFDGAVVCPALPGFPSLHPRDAK